MMSAQVMAALIAALITAVGWVVAYRLTVRRDERARTRELRVKHLERQIEEFYGPLHSLVEQVMVISDVQEQVLNPEAGTTIGPERSARVREYLRSQYFRPLHEQIALILRTKLYLVEGVALPESFYNYLAHTTQERLQADLWNDQQLDTSHIEGREWDPRFPKDIRGHLDRLMKEYDTLTQEQPPTSNRARPSSR